MIKLHQFKSAFDLPNLSPFCMKVETYLRMAGLEYETVLVTIPSKLPKGKAPIIEDNGQMIADSTFIIRYLEKAYNVDLDSGLSKKQRVLGWAFGRMLEEHYYWLLVYSRWLDDRSWPTMKKAFFDQLPPVARFVVPTILRNRQRRNLHAQGIGRHSEEEIYELAKADLMSVAEELGDKPFFMGESPTTIDAIVYSFIANSIQTPLKTPIQQAAADFENFSLYCDRMKRRYFS